MNDSKVNIPNPIINCDQEYGTLEQVIVVPPRYMEIKEIINETQQHYAKENINIDRAIEQHEYFINVLQKNGAEVYYLEPASHLNEQVFTRDIGFTIADNLFIASMNRDIRQQETAVLKQWLNHHEVNYKEINTPSMEGGDVMVDGDKVWVGISGRTTQAAVSTLQEHLPEHDVITIKLAEGILHLDCVFNVLDEQTALVYPEGMDKASYKKVAEKYQIITVTEEEQFQMGPNVLPIGNRKIITLPENKRLNKEIQKANFETIEVPFSEIIKSGGSYRCCTLPLRRGN